jgi:hypothetical protein
VEGFVKYKITIGYRVFDAEETDGFMYLRYPEGGRDNLRIHRDQLNFLGAKIAPVEPMRVEFEGMVPINKDNIARVSVTGISESFGCNLIGWNGKRCKITVEQIIEPKPCEHLYNENMFTQPKCSKCGAKR